VAIHQHLAAMRDKVADLASSLQPKTKQAEQLRKWRNEREKL
jgi:hypothetical protein